MHLVFSQIRLFIITSSTFLHLKWAQIAGSWYEYISANSGYVHRCSPILKLSFEMVHIPKKNSPVHRNKNDSFPTTWTTTVLVCLSASTCCYGLVRTDLATRGDTYDVSPKKLNNKQRPFNRPVIYLYSIFAMYLPLSSRLLAPTQTAGPLQRHAFVLSLLRHYKVATVYTVNLAVISYELYAKQRYIYWSCRLEQAHSPVRCDSPAQRRKACRQLAVKVP